MEQPVDGGEARCREGRHGGCELMANAASDLALAGSPSPPGSSPFPCVTSIHKPTRPPPLHRRHHHNSMHGGPPLPAIQPPLPSAGLAAGSAFPPRLRPASSSPQPATGFAARPLARCRLVCARGTNDTGIHGIDRLSISNGWGISEAERNGTETGGAL